MSDDDTRRRLGHSEARARILEAAARVYNRRGEKATVQQIAEEADYSTSALYKHFSDKDDIFENLWRSVKKELLDVVASEPTLDLGFVDRLKWHLYKLAEFAEEEHDLFLASMASAPTPTRAGDLDDSVVEIYEGFQEAMRSVMQQGLDEGILDDSRSADLYGMALGGQVRALIDRWALQGPFPMRPRLEEMLEIFLRGAASEEAREELSLDF
jgi:AcrR family transcriptional regulator